MSAAASTSPSSSSPLTRPPPSSPASAPSASLGRTAFVARAVAAAILAQTLFFKFTGAPEAVHIFTTLGVEPWGRIALGVVELITALLLLVPATRALGAVLGVGLMLGAVGSHLGPLGIDVQGDGGTLFALALLTLACCAFAAIVHRHEIPWIGPRLR